MTKYEDSDDALIVDGVHVLFHPWEFWELSKLEFLDWAYAQEKKGTRLVTETLVNAYPDDVNSWVVEHIVYTDWRTGEDIWEYDPAEAEVDGQLDDLLVVARRLVRAD